MYPEDVIEEYPKELDELKIYYNGLFNLTGYELEIVITTIKNRREINKLKKKLG